MPAAHQKHPVKVGQDVCVSVCVSPAAAAAAVVMENDTCNLSCGNSPSSVRSRLHSHRPGPVLVSSAALLHHFNVTTKEDIVDRPAAV